MAISIDTDIILAAGVDSDSVTDMYTLRAFDRALERRDTIFFTNTTIVEIGLANERYNSLMDEFEKGASRVQEWYKAKALQITGASNGIAWHASEDLLRRFEENELERHHALLIAEAAVSERIKYLWTWDPKLLQIKNSKLSIVLEDNDLNSIQIVSPYEYLTYTCNGVYKPENR